MNLSDAVNISIEETGFGVVKYKTYAYWYNPYELENIPMDEPMIWVAMVGTSHEHSLRHFFSNADGIDKCNDFYPLTLNDLGEAEWQEEK